MFLLLIAGPNYSTVGVFPNRVAAESAVIAFVNGSEFRDDAGVDDDDPSIIRDFPTAATALAANAEFLATIQPVELGTVYDLEFSNYTITATS